MTVVKDTQKVGTLVHAHIVRGTEIRFQYSEMKKIAVGGVIETVFHCNEMTMIVVSGIRYRLDWYKYSAEYFSGRGACFELVHVSASPMLCAVGHEISAIRVLSPK